MITKIAATDLFESITSNQAGRLFTEFTKKFVASEATIQVLQKVILMTPESIHLNSFMYEPILDMSDEHLRKLYQAGQGLE